jgi:hypothetical protein
MTPDWTPVTPRTLDARDMTKEPPAYLDPWSAWRNQRRSKEFWETGRMTWPRGKDWIQ